MTVVTNQQDSNNYWSKAAIIDELSYQLSSTSSFTIDQNTGQFRITHKYYDRAEFVLYRMNIWKFSTPPIFIINISDIIAPLRNELEKLKLNTPEQFDRAVTEAIQSLMEGINERYYHVSRIAYKITWRFDP